MRAHPALLSLSTILLVFLSPGVPAQNWLDIVKDKAAARAVDHAEQAIDQGLDATEDAIKCVVTDQACIDSAQQSGKPVVVTNKKGKPLPPDQQPKASVSTGATGAAKSASAGQGSGQPNLTAVKSDFVPGEKTIFFDDFSDMAGDEPPPHWKVRGGTAELRTGDGVRQLTLTTHAMTLSPNLKGLPKNFTLEADLQFGGITGNGNGVIWTFRKINEGPATLNIDMRVQLEGTRITVLAGNADAPDMIGNATIALNPQRPVQFGLWVQDGRIRVYVNGARIVDANQIQLDQINFVDLQSIVEVDVPGAYAGVRRVRFAESAPDFSKVITSGRYVTHGILFDTDSDRIKPESAPVIKMVAQGLQANPGLKLLIEGYTDSSGDASHNMDLSRRRADAVKAVLVSQFGIDAARLTTAGLGASKPIASNDTPQGRAENRRVEFVKQ
jgi:outer membrane protein OmpA-like peptidoglycan-associated protein